MFRLPYKIRWENSVFLITTFTLTLTALPAYLWYNGLSLFQFALFIFFFISKQFINYFTISIINRCRKHISFLTRKISIR